MGLTNHLPDPRAFLSLIRRATTAAARVTDEQSPIDGGVQNQTPDWPILEPTALYGLAGEVVRLIGPHTEADPLALLVSFLSEVGTMLNRGPHLMLDGTYHPLLFWPVIVGQSSKSRKGTAGKRIQELLSLADDTWTRGESKGTLSTGEGLAQAVRDPVCKEEPVRERGLPTGKTVTVLEDTGVEDKRLFLVQSEFGSVLRVMARDGNSLSGALRDAWDGSTLAYITKNNRVRATNPHIGIVGHVTKDELLRNLNDTEAVNGFGNRFCWFLVRRSKELPFPSAPSQTDLSMLANRINAALRGARCFGTLTLTEPFRTLWEANYSDLSADRPGIAGALLARAEAQVMRIAAIHACLDGTSSIGVLHLQAAMALWRNAEAATRMIFGDNLGDPIADKIMRALAAEEELSESKISALFSRHVSAPRLDQAKVLLVRNGMAHSVSVDQGAGRQAVIWRRGAKKAN